ncbi:MAG TPA: N-acetylmuramoyl-L-alanine amidase, partial [Gemmatimonadaceae bacterium]|nr:N-acetylmuramoyl-L-alanine amidase [Gemmatimonadaceae bacterium]
MRPGLLCQAAVLVCLAACSTAPAPVTGPVPAPAPATAPAAPAPRSAPVPPAAAPAKAPPLPPIPAVDGPLSVRVVYPSSNQQLTVRDTNYIFGSVGSGSAHLTIDGFDVPVLPNGAFLAWIPVPPAENPRYELHATKGAETANATLPVRLPAVAAPLPDTGRLIVDRGSVVPSGTIGLRGDERVRVSIRAPSNADVVLRLGDGSTVPLVHGGGVAWSAEINARELARAGTIVAKRGRDSVSVETGTITQIDATPRRFVSLRNSDVDATSDTDQVTILRPTPGGTYKWLLFPHTVVELTGFRGSSYRVRLDSQLEAWVDSSAAQIIGGPANAPRRTASNARAIVGERFTDLRIPVTEKPPYQVESMGDALILTLYGTVSNVDIVNFSTSDPAVRNVTWEQAASDRIRFTVHLRQHAYGWLALWDRGNFVLRVRHTPVVDPARPLAGRIIAVDPGHPPIGTTGPTGFYEGDAVLAVATHLRAMLESKGATVVMTRTTRAPVALGSRPIIARRADAEAFVSVHLNAYPDGVNPYRARNGTNTYFFFDIAEPLARAVQRGLVRQMGLPDMGINYDNLAVARQTWMPAI